MTLPLSLYQAIVDILKTQPRSDIQKARRALTERYRGPSKTLISEKNDVSNRAFMNNTSERLSYIATRMPATYAVCHQLFSHLSSYVEDITSLLDLGAGPATVLWAAYENFPHLSQVTLVEEDQHLATWGLNLIDSALGKKNITFTAAKIQTAYPFKPHSLVTLSYVLGELPQNQVASILTAAWQASEKFLMIVEPGTPEGFERIREARAQLIMEGAYILAPCPHENKCPMVGKDWCHFNQRLERTPLHRQIKESSLPYEDEKYSYVIAAKNPVDRSTSRIIKRPKQASGHFILDLCTQNGLKREIISKKTPVLYRSARHMKWGDAGPL